MSRFHELDWALTLLTTLEEMREFRRVVENFPHFLACRGWRWKELVGRKGRTPKGRKAQEDRAPGLAAAASERQGVKSSSGSQLADDERHQPLMSDELEQALRTFGVRPTRRRFRSWCFTRRRRTARPALRRVSLMTGLCAIAAQMRKMLPPNAVVEAESYAGAGTFGRQGGELGCAERRCMVTAKHKRAWEIGTAVLLILAILIAVGGWFGYEESRRRLDRELQRVLSNSTINVDAAVPQVRKLIAKGADAASKGQQGETSLMVAAAGGDVVLTEALLGKGANVNEHSAVGHTALMWAAQAGRSETVRVLLAHGADPSLSDGSGNTARSLASYGRHSAVVRMLTRAGAK